VTADDVQRVATELFSGGSVAATVVGSGTPNLSAERLALQAAEK
jgi:hypothetical protein